jgi:hypothetical protein
VPRRVEKKGSCQACQKDKQVLIYAWRFLHAAPFSCSFVLCGPSAPQQSDKKFCRQFQDAGKGKVFRSTEQTGPTSTDVHPTSIVF